MAMERDELRSRNANKQILNSDKLFLDSFTAVPSEAMNQLTEDIKAEYEGMLPPRPTRWPTLEEIRAYRDSHPFSSMSRPKVYLYPPGREIRLK